MKRYSLKWRLVLTVSTSFILIWIVAFSWLYFSLNQKMNQTLDNRLSASTHMVARLLSQLPLDELRTRATPAVSDISQNSLIACEVSIFSSDVAIGQTVVARTRGAPDSLISREQGFSTWAENNTEWRSYVLKKGELQVVSAERIHSRSMLLYEVLSSVLWPLILTLMICICLILWMIRFEFKPVDTITQQLMQLNGQLAEELSYLSSLKNQHIPHEIEPFVETLVNLIHRLNNSLEAEKNLSAFASHELRSPLTAIKTHVQLSRMIAVQEQSNPALISNLKDAEQNIERYRQFLEQLLLLSRTEHMQAECTEPVSSMQCLQDVMTELELQYPEIQQRVHIEWEGLGMVSMNRDALKIVLRNIIENALNHSDSTEKIQISMHGMMLSIADTGSGLSESEISMATSRFWRKSARNTGHGIGLALTQALMQQAGHRLNITENQPQGLKVILEFSC